jgi:3',5'-cyclic AMP phosphodiesterase CpdA
MLKTLPMPFFRVAGNHDFNNDVSARIWKELYGPDYYSFIYKDVLFMCLNSQDSQSKYGDGIGADQIAWAKDTLAKNSDARWVCLFFHKPLWLEDEKRLERAKTQDGATQLTGFNQIEKLLDGRNYTVFAGHHHRYGKWVKNGNKYFRLATTGGQSALGGPEAGQFDHIMWVTMTDKGPIVCNIQLSGILDEDAKVNLPE